MQSKPEKTEEPVQFLWKWANFGFLKPRSRANISPLKFQQNKLTCLHKCFTLKNSLKTKAKMDLVFAFMLAAFTASQLKSAVESRNVIYPWVCRWHFYSTYCIYYMGKEFKDIIHALTLKDLRVWCCKNNLTVHTGKTMAMLISSHAFIGPLLKTTYVGKFLHSLLH